MEGFGEIFVLPGFGQGHLFPCMELCKHFSSLNYKATLIIPSHLSSSIPPSFRDTALIGVVEIPNSPASPPPLPPSDGHIRPFRMHQERIGSGLEAFLSKRTEDPTQTRPVCAVVDVMMGWSQEVFGKFGIQPVSFFTSGATSAAMQNSSWKDHTDTPGKRGKYLELMEGMDLSHSELQRQDRWWQNKRPVDGPDGPPGGKKLDRPKWLDEAKRSNSLLVNTCDSLELPFLNYIADKIGKPVYGVGPLLPEKYWTRTTGGSILHDGQVRSNRESNYTEEQVVQWLDRQTRQSVIYIAFGSEVGPSLEEYRELADALGESTRPFVWSIQPNAGKSGPPPGVTGERPGSEAKEEGYYPHGLREQVGDRGLIIKGWAPQLLILGHPSVGGFLSHCGWNSTVESIGKGVPILAWPIRGDQFHNAKLVAKHWRVGHTVLTEEDPAEMVKKESIVGGIDFLLDDREVSKRAEELSRTFLNGFPSSSDAALTSFIKAVTLHKFKCSTNCYRRENGMQ